MSITAETLCEPVAFDRPAPGADEPATSAAEHRTSAKRKRRERAVDLEIRHETAIDFDTTAKLADEGFGFTSGTFQADALRWLYEDAFSDGTTVLGVYTGERKVGHLALVHHSVALEGRIERAVALVDLFILPAFRSRTAISNLYEAVAALCRGNGIRFIIAMPNEKAAPVNRRHLKLTDAALFDIRVGLAWPLWPGRSVASYRIGDINVEDALPILADYCDDAVPGLHWTGPRLWARLQKPGADYALHVGERVLAISAPRTKGRTPYTLICALLPRPGFSVRGRDVGAVVAAACRTHRNPLFIYTGLNNVVPKPGVPLPKRFRPSQMILQMRDFAAADVPVAFGRFEPLDFDFC